MRSPAFTFDISAKSDWSSFAFQVTWSRLTSTTTAP